MTELNSSNRFVTTSVYGVRMPIITEGADIKTIITDTLTSADNTTYQSITLNDGDIIGITESFLARSQGNYVKLTDISQEVSKHFPTGDVAIAFPILSRNRFAKVLEGISKGIKGKAYVFLSFVTFL